MEAPASGPVAELNPPRRRRWPVVVLGLAVLLLLVLMAAGVAMLGVRADLDRGQQRLGDARRALASGNLDDAAERFASARSSFDAAADRTDGLPARAGSWIPFLGNNVDAGAALAAAGGEAARAGQLLASAFEALPDGLGSLAPSDGTLPLDTIASLMPPVADASTHADAALQAVEGAPSSFLLGPVAQARFTALDELGDAVRALDAAELLLGELPAFAGGDGPRRYLVASENPAELRGTGGIWGAYAVLTLDEGAPSFSRVQTISGLPDVDGTDVAAPSPDYDRNYAQFGGAGSWQNLNMTPDFPTAARAALGAYEVGTGMRLDGLIAADPFALEAMLRITGPSSLPGTEIQLSADDVVAFTTNEAYSRFEGPTERKELLGTVAIDVFERFLDLEGKGIARIRALAAAMSEGHLKIATNDEAFERALEVAGADGGLRTRTGGDLLAVHVNNAAGNKIDYYATRSLSHRVELGGDGEAVSTTSITIANGAPASGQPRYVLGPFVEGLEAGDQRSLTSLSCHEPCTFVDGAADGRSVTFDTGSERGVPWFRDFATIPAGDEREIVMTTRTTGVWEGNGSGGVYRLSVLGQTTIIPTALHVEIQAPAGTEIVWTSEPMAIDGGTAVWEGEADRRLELEVRFSAPLPLRWWRNVTRPFGGP